MTKQQLRTYYKQKRLAIDEKDKLKMDNLILIQFQQLAFENAEVLFSYRPMEMYSEPNTMLFSRYLNYIIPELTIAYPLINPATGIMNCFAVNEETHYQTNSYGITEPIDGIPVPPEEIDIVFVPLLICDKKGYRVGFGKGYYDKYLANCKDDVLKISFSYFDPIDKIEDIQSFDIPLDYCITPSAIYEF